jgi:hypothetical protein
MSVKNNIISLYDLQKTGVIIKNIDKIINTPSKK